MKRLLFCFDGMWNRLEAPFPTNVVITAESVDPLGGSNRFSFAFSSSSAFNRRAFDTSMPRHLAFHL